MHEYMPPGVNAYKLYMNAYEGKDGKLHFRDMAKRSVPESLLNPDLITRTTKEADIHYGTTIIGSNRLKYYLSSSLVLLGVSIYI